MVKSIQKYFLLFFCVLVFHCSSATVRFEQLNVLNPYDTHSIEAIMQDSIGNIWFAYSGGVSRYDGNSIKRFNYQTNIEEGSPHIERIRNLKAQGGKLWMRSNSNVYAFDLMTEQFEVYHTGRSVDFAVNHSDVWVATPTRIYNLLNDQQSISIDLLPREQITKIQLFNHFLYVGTSQRVVVYNLNTYKEEVLLSDIEVAALFIDSRQAIWLVDTSQGLMKRLSNGTTQIYTKEDGILSYDITCFEEDNDGSIWVGGLKGINEIALNGQIKQFQYDPNKVGGPSNNSILSLFKDRDGGIWTGTYNGGINYFNPTDHLYYLFEEDLTENRGLSYKVVSQMSEDAKGNVWICTEGGWLNYLDRQTNRFLYYPPLVLNDGTIINNIKSIYKENDQKLWLGTFNGGLVEFDVDKQSYTSYARQQNGQYLTRANRINEIKAFAKKLYMATHSAVQVFDPETEQLTDLFSERTKKQYNIYNFLRCIEIKDSVLWTGGSNGLIKFDLNSKTIKRYLYDAKAQGSLGSNQVHDLFVDSYNNLWIATSKGLNKYNPEGDDFEVFDMQDGMENDFVVSIEELEPNMLIVGTKIGICILDFKNNVIENIDRFNGLPINAPNLSSILVMNNDDVFVGGIDGLCAFNFRSILDSKEINAPRLTKLLVNNKEVNPNDTTGILKQSFILTDEIVLNHRHTSFSIEFHDNHFFTHKRQKLKYKLEGFDDNWLESESNSVNYTNLDPGKYTFTIGNSKEPGLFRKLNITIKSHPLQSTLAYILYLILFLSTVFYLNRLHLIRRRLKDGILLKEQEKAYEVEMNQSKLRFFTNISHEFRTPLTLIAGHVESLLSSNSIQHSDYKKVLSINRNTSRLNNLISELLDFRKQEAGQLKLKVGEHDFITFVEEIFYSFVELAKHKNIEYQIVYSHKPMHVWFDSMHLEKVFYNLLSNAFKFTPDGGHVLMSITEESNVLEIKVADSGQGIPQDSMDTIFDRFNQLNNMTSDDIRGSGIGLALTKGIVEAHQGEISVSSTPHKGSVFTVRLPLGKNHFSDDQLCEIQAADTLIKEGSIDDVVEVPAEEKDKEKLLVVEDNIEVQGLLFDLLNPLFEVSLAANGVEGLQKALELQPVIIVSDVLMPQMTGTEMCSNLKTNVNTSHIPIILLTARTAEEYKIEGLDTGADDYITKPFNSRVLVARINNIINNRKALQAKFSQNPSVSVKKIAKNKIDKEFIEKAKEAVENNLDNAQYDVTALCRDLQLGRTVLYSKMKAITGKTPNAFIMSFRLEKSKQLLLENPEEAISKIAYDCGFTSQQYFSKMFKDQFGVTPKKYINSHS
ncbi:hybrid sensor histidine kinase/response regulator transcription factor [Carboxylicivirga marina]|uniref:hybrid sensor histidine kinase/response regulator transcription factor n=1 Tax=Carboxylicivirga marina TaxID=2800988 RepID=UPI0025958080|nr:hybrid sensor histidine kinase/response regulator transcription factor [uncultured Carboxylicivirga sp.]